MSKVYVVVEISVPDNNWANEIIAVYPSTILLKTAKRRVQAFAKKNFRSLLGDILNWKWKEHSANEWNYAHEYYGQYYGYILTLIEVTK
jgi:hypothetical protein